jgi:hypothetical protein
LLTRFVEGSQHDPPPLVELDEDVLVDAAELVLEDALVEADVLELDVLELEAPPPPTLRGGGS